MGRDGRGMDGTGRVASAHGVGVGLQFPDGERASRSPPGLAPSTHTALIPPFSVYISTKMYISALQKRSSTSTSLPGGGGNLKPGSRHGRRGPRWS